MLTKASAALVLLAACLSAQTLELARAGSVLTYTVKYTARGHLDLGQGAEKAPNVSSRSNVQTTLSGRQIITILQPAGSGAMASVRFAQPVAGIQINGLPQGDMSRVTGADLAKTVYIHLGGNGGIERIEFPKGYTAVARNLLRGILAAQQFVLPADGQLAPSWQAREKGAQSSYVARYTAQPEEGGLKRVSKKLPDGKVDFSIDTAVGTVRAVRATLHEDVTIQSRPAGANDVTLSLELVSSEEATEAVLRSARATYLSVRGSLSSAATEEANESAEGQAAVQRQILGDDTLATVQQALTLADQQTLSNDQRTRTYLKLKALLILEPAQSPVFQKALTAADLSKASSRMIAGALAAAGTPQTQSALCAVVEARKGDGAALTRLVPELGSIPKPTEATVRFLSDFSRTIAIGEGRAAALMALGSMAGSLSKAAPQRAETIVQDLIARWSPMKDQAILLLALGNSQSPRAQRFILTQKGDASTVVRRAAATALSSFHSTESDDALCGLLKSDSDPSVRSAAAQSLTPRNAIPLVRQALLNAAQQDKMDSVRIAGMFAVSSTIPKDREVRSVIEKISKSDASKSVREQAAKLLELPQNAPGPPAKAR